MIARCPYCDGTNGYYYIEHVQQRVNCHFDGQPINHCETKVFYTGSKMCCIDCDEKITSFVRGVHKEVTDG